MFRLYLRISTHTHKASRFVYIGDTFSSYSNFKHIFNTNVCIEFDGSYPLSIIILDWTK